MVGNLPCGTCRGRVVRKVYRCLHAEHDQTTMADCGRCADYRPVEAIGASTRRLLLRFPHGFGDAVQLTTVLLHLRAMHPGWSVDVAVKRGADSLLAGLCRESFALNDEPPPATYDIRRSLAWHEPEACYANSPSTKAERCLREVFRIAPREEHCRYHIAPGADARRRADRYASELARPFVLVHYQGNSARGNKNLDERVVAALMEEVLRLGHQPVVLDWDGRSRLVDGRRVVCPGADHPLWGGIGTGDGATLAALAQRAAWCVGIDSGPGHVFGAVDTPATIVWTRHHPLHYYGLAANVTHLVPSGHRQLLRGDADTGLRYFEAKYRYRTYLDLARSLVLSARENLGADAANGLIVDGDHLVRRGHRQADMVIVRDVYLDDCYGVTELPLPPRYVVDVGAHIGTFARRVRRRTGRCRIVCVEANSANLPALEANVGEFAHIVSAACSYEAGEVGLLSTVFPGSDNTGGSTVVPLGGPAWRRKAARPCYRPGCAVPKITLEEIRRRFDLPRIDLLKLDCEGSEFDILEHCDLTGIEQIVGEYHDRERFHRLLERRFGGWPFRLVREGPMGLFFLRRKDVGGRRKGE